MVVEVVVGQWEWRAVTHLLTEPFARLVVLECAVRAVAEQRVELGGRELAVEVAVAALLRLDAIEHRLVQTDAEEMG